MTDDDSSEGNMRESTRTVLIVDDEASIRQSLSDYFDDHLWRSLPAESGEMALALMEKESPAGAVVDIRLRGMDGDAFIREACRRKPDTAFVICTGSPEYDVPADLLKLPCVSSRVFRKPVADMAAMEKEILAIIEGMKKGAMDNE